jgi:protein-L-isoaspartate(D-aspartate) O-methyltransferase
MRIDRSSSCLVCLLAAMLAGSASCKESLPPPRAAEPSAAAVPSSSSGKPSPPDPNAPAWTHPRSTERIEHRRQMVEVLRQRYDMTDPNVLAAMEAVPRHWFVPSSRQRTAYADSPLPIGHGQTISQPFIVAFMTQLLDLTPASKVLEIGTGSGYQAAVLTEFTPHVYTIEIVEPLGQRAKQTFQERGYHTIRTTIGDGYKGWPEHAPFDAVIVTCAPDHIPKPLIEQLRTGGRIVIPVGGVHAVQELYLVVKRADGSLSRRPMMPVRFVPLLRDRE